MPPPWPCFYCQDIGEHSPRTVMQPCAKTFQTEFPPLPPHPLTLHAAHPRAVVNSQENRSSPGVHPRSLDLNIIAPILVKFHSDNNCSHAIYKVLNHTQEEFLWHWSSKSKTNIHVGNRAALVLECKSPQVWASEHLQREHLGFKSVSYADFWTPPSRDLRWVRISGDNAQKLYF